MPLRVSRDLPTDPLSSISSVLAKMQNNEAASIQILIQPAGRAWSSLGRSYVAKVKRDEATPEKASFKVDAKTLEAVEQKVSKPGFHAVVRLVVSSDTRDSARVHLENLISAFGQFASDHNYFTKTKILNKRMFMV